MSVPRFELGAACHGSTTTFRVWAPDARQMELVLEREQGPEVHRMEKFPDDYFSVTAPAHAGDLYRFKIDGRGPFPDPASRYQPQGVHGPSMVVDPSSFRWADEHWHGISMKELAFYELHVGTFTPEGTFRAAATKLPYLRALGITAVELMPVADFAGNHNWGYDGVSPFAPARCYGTPDDLRSFVDAAHGLGLAVFLDVVYNHLGPDGAYQSVFSRHYYTKAHQSPWGDGINFDGAMSGAVRDYFTENALRWIHEYHFDGLRLDATHAIVDDSPQHILAAIAGEVRASLAGTVRHAWLIAEDDRNLAQLVQPEPSGFGLDGIWADDFHHQIRRCLAGDHDGYFQDFDGSAASIAKTIQQGWFFTGQPASYFGKARGTDPSGLAYRQFILCIQNHDQIGNRAFGDRLHHSIDLAAYRAASALLLLLPETPLLFMGQEWAASSPFQYFTDHHQALGALVTEGRRREFRRFAAFAQESAREAIPDPQSPATFERSHLPWEEQDREPHRSLLALYRLLLHVRRNELALQSDENSGELAIKALDDNVIVMRRSHKHQHLLAVVRLHGEGSSALSEHPIASGTDWEILCTTEDAAFAVDPFPPEVDMAPLTVRFSRPGAVIFKSRPERAREDT